MLIRFIPAALDQSTIIFSLSFSDSGRQCPPSLAAELQRVIQDNLEPPQSWHTIDKSVGLVCLIEEIIFQARERVIYCKLKDGSTEEWNMQSSCAQMLHLVLADVNDATLHEREAKLLAQGQPTRDSITLSLNSLKNKHKKQRSLISFFSSLVPPYSNNQPAPPVIHEVAQEPPSPTVQVSPRVLRRRARSTLVDAFRIYALPELKKRMPKAGYYQWILQSMLRRTIERMRELVETHDPYPAFPEDWGRRASLSVPSLFYGEPSDDESDTLPTPCSHTDPFGHFRSSQRDSKGAAPDHPSRGEYAAVSALTSHLEHLAFRDQQQEEAKEQEDREIDLILEIRSRRRAWLNKALVSTSCKWDMASPFQSSPLAIYSRGQEEYSAVSSPEAAVSVDHGAGDDTCHSLTSAFNPPQSDSTTDVKPCSSSLTSNDHLTILPTHEIWQTDLPKANNILTRTLRQSLSVQSEQDLQDATWTFRGTALGCH